MIRIGAIQRDVTLLLGDYHIPAGKCASDTNPDAWFPEVGRRGGITPKLYQEIAAETKRAVDICNSCPAKEKCLEAGMDPVNLPFGIWGGTLPPERMLASGKTFARYSDEGKTLFGLQGLRPYFKEAGLEGAWYGD